MKNSIALFTFMCILNMAAAQDTVKIYVNSKLAGTAITKGSDEIPVVKIKKIKSSLLKNITVQLGRNNAQNSLYKKSITTLLVAEENKKQPGSFYLPVNIIGKKLAAGKKVKLVLQLNPPDDRMMMPSRMMELCYIVM
jgi:hypothetical protein